MILIIIITKGDAHMKTPLERLTEYVKDKKLKSSTQRNHILSIMVNEKRHRTIEEIYTIAKKGNSDIGIATVYRTVRLLCDAGIVREIYMGHDVTRYEIITDESHHDHLICVKCGRFIEVESDVIEKEQLRIAQSSGFELTNHSLIMYGICNECRKK
jgi:Fur family transcriptional regulator, ferric uptake regulator